MYCIYFKAFFFTKMIILGLYFGLVVEYFQTTVREEEERKEEKKRRRRKFRC